MFDIDARQYEDGWAFTITILIKTRTAALFRSDERYATKAEALIAGGEHLLYRFAALLQEAPEA